MDAQQQKVATSTTEVNALASSLGVDGKMEVLNHLLAELSDKDLEKLPTAVRQALLEVLPARKGTTPTVAPVVPSVVAVPSASIELAEKIFGTLEVIGLGLDFRLTIPANVSDIAALKSLNGYFQERYRRGWPRLSEQDYTWYANQLTVSSRDISKERKIRICMPVPLTQGKYRRDQLRVLKEADMTFAAPEEVALVLAAYACKSGGNVLRSDGILRTSAPGVLLCGVGEVLINRECDDQPNIAAAGVPLSSKKKLTVGQRIMKFWGI